ncbi:MAG: MBL fold metallo-hydrolase [Micrococcales bacterium]|nr:MBL fold metallo-hydrolase [Micrococcales bacterium]
MDNNVYLLTCRRTGAQILIDAADDAPAITRLLATAHDDVPPHSPTPHLECIITTHSHWDHVRALADVAALTGATLLAGAPDVADIEAGAGVTGVTGLSHGDQVTAGDITLDVIHLRGHTPGSVALALAPAIPPSTPAAKREGEESSPERGGPTPATRVGERGGEGWAGAGSAPGVVRLFTGDSLFPGGLGNTWGDSDRFAQLHRDVAERLFDAYPDSAIVHPGHGGATTLGVERPHLQEWKRRGW